MPLKQKSSELSENKDLLQTTYMLFDYSVRCMFCWLCLKSLLLKEESTVLLGRRQKESSFSPGKALLPHGKSHHRRENVVWSYYKQKLFQTTLPAKPDCVTE